MFESLEEKICQPVEVGEGEHVAVAGFGNVTGNAVVDGKKETVTFKSVLFVPTMICNLLSVSRARRAGCRVTFDGNNEGSGYCESIQNISQKVCLKGIERPGGLYEAVFASNRKERALTSVTFRTKLWHKHLAHVSPNVIDKTILLVDDLKLSKSLEPSCICKYCAIRKSSRKPLPLAKNESFEATEPL